MKKSIFFFVIAFVFFDSFAQITISGKITGGQSGEELIGASVYILETKQGTSTDLDGSYQITGVSSGKYTIITQYISYKSDTLRQVSLSDNQVYIHNVKLQDASVKMETVTIQAKANKASSNYMLAMQKKAASVVDGITAQQIKKAGDSDAAGAVKRITGVSVEGGKYVYIRGLSDRYAKTTLNGAEIPGLDPNRNTVQLDLYPTNLIDNITVTKTFTPNLPGSFTAGLVDILTKDFPNKFDFYFSSTLSFNTQSTFNSNTLSQEKSSTDWLGFDDGKRAIPSVVQDNEVVSPCFTCGINQGSNVLLTSQTKSFSKEWVPTKNSPFLDQSYSIGVGNQTTLFSKSFGYNVGLSYSNKNRYYNNGINNRFSLTENINEAKNLNPEELLIDQKSVENTLLGGVLNLSMKFNENNKIGFTIIRNQNGTATTRTLTGEIPKDEIGRYIETRNIQYIERAMTSYQLRGGHSFKNFKKLKMDWIAAYTSSNQNTPDFRIFTSDFSFDSNGQKKYQLSPNLYLEPTRYFRNMEEVNTDIKLNFELPLTQNQKESKILKFGIANLSKSRDFSEKWFVFTKTGVSFNGDPVAYFSDQNMVVGQNNGSTFSFINVVNATDKQNSYKGKQTISAAYGMFDLKLNSLWRIIAGARIESTNIDVESMDLDLKKGKLVETDLLPSLNITYNVNEKSNLRFALTRTLARPTFRELAPYATFDLETRYVKVGNPNLERTLIDNIDFRWETFPNSGEIIALSLFYKKFHKPIETVINPFAANTEITWQNQDFANVYGLELEARKNLGRFSPHLKSFSAGANFTYVFSETQIGKDELIQIKATDPDAKTTRQMFGQSPYIMNSYISYTNDSLDLEVNLSFNVSGPKLILVVGGGTPDIYEQAKPSLNLNISKGIAKKWTLKASGNNLLNSPTRRVYKLNSKSYDFQRYTDGVNFSLGITYKI
ncbi:MAG: TonB-dependent receptor [Bacteroidetes bacterium]|nr:MAG: TonB-dependent receptor [Bacteroidota bacterium]MBL1144014.1 TonB-dependent receptor [Bacteroidota bacterium]NOG56815.1 TonB-dependent receptor [Bacteroidota bacterium]